MIGHARFPHSGSPARAPLRVVPRIQRSLRITRKSRTIRITRTLSAMLLLATDTRMDPELALNIGITVEKVGDSGVGPDE